MKYIKQNKSAETGGTFLQGHLECDFDTLIKIFGEPERENIDTHKTDAEWTLETPFGVATIYNYKNGKNYLGEEGLELSEITEWNIGGHSKEVAILIEVAIDSYLAGLKG